MSALLDQLAQQSRLLTVEEKATLARILIDELDPSIAESSNVAASPLWTTPIGL